MIGLTRRQAQCLAAIRESVKTRGIAPSFDELVAELGLASKSEVTRLLNCLEERGHISRLNRRARAIEIVVREDGTAALVAACRALLESIVAEDEDGDAIACAHVGADALGEVELVLKEHFP